MRMNGRWAGLCVTTTILYGCAHVKQEINLVQEGQHQRAVCATLLPSGSSSVPLSFELQGRWQAESLHPPHSKSQGYFEASYEAQAQQLRILLTSAWGIPMAEITYVSAAPSSLFIKLASGERLNEAQWSEYTAQHMGVALVLPMADLIDWLQPDFPHKARMMSAASSLSSDTIHPLSFSGTLNDWMLSWRGHPHEQQHNGQLCNKFFPSELSLQPLLAGYRINLDIDQKESLWK